MYKYFSAIYRQKYNLHFQLFTAFAAHFYLKLVGHKSEVYEDGIKELELLKGQLSTAEEGGAGGGSEEDQNATPTTAAASAVQIV